MINECIIKVYTVTTYKEKFVSFQDFEVILKEG